VAVRLRRCRGGTLETGAANRIEDTARLSQLLFETDWLASKPVFYNQEDGRASHNVNDVVDFANVELDPDGFNNFLDFGYSVFEQTPVRAVKFLPPSSRLFREASGTLRIETDEDPVPHLLSRRLSEEEVIDLVRSTIVAWERSITGEIVIPTSGGFDSRLLNLMVADKHRIRQFTYGHTSPQTGAQDVRRAALLARILGTRWEWVELGDFHRFLALWNELHGVSTHAHGMYQMEFYSRVVTKLGGGKPLLSGLCGDLFAGSGNIKRERALIRRPADLLACFRIDRWHADSTMTLLRGSGEPLEAYFERQREAIADPIRRVVELVRMRIMLLSYLLRVPEYFGFSPRAPFTDIDIGTAMLALPPERRTDRLWLRDFFASQNVLLEHIRGASFVTLPHQAMRRVPLRLLDEDLLREVVRPDYVRWINRNVGRIGLPWEGYATLQHRRGFRRLMNLPARLGVKEQRMPAYVAYMNLRPIESLLRRRNRERER
jgi:asparagine synthetase B (glutamine-hydrolysing)